MDAAGADRNAGQPSFAEIDGEAAEERQPPAIMPAHASSIAGERVRLEEIW
jgi:hypothetical protein